MDRSGDPKQSSVGTYEPGTTSSKLHNPCVRNCCLDNDDICLGCFRNLDEIKSWYKLDREQRQLVLDKADIRKQEAQARYGQTQLIG